MSNLKSMLQFLRLLGSKKAFLQHFTAYQQHKFSTLSEHLQEVVHAKFQVNAAIFVAAKPKEVGKMLFLQHFSKSSITFLWDTNSH